MELRIFEYNVTPNVNEKNEFTILMANDTLVMNGNEKNDESKVVAIKKMLEDNKENIIRLAAENAGNYKGGRQKNLAVKFDNDGETFRIIGNTPSQEISDFYTKIVNDITNIVSK
ncbi:MAG: hypothetical protein IKX00_03715 [Bacilli bacterium]|nr:hypothetical protein [Bacilli bacterium]